jgi:hypothetical protein
MPPRETKNPGGYSGATGYEQRNASTANISEPAEKSNYQSALQFTSQEAAAVDYGVVTLRLHVEGGRLTRYTVNTERSFLAGGISKAPIKT